MWDIFTTGWGWLWLTVTNMLTFIVSVVVIMWFSDQDDDGESEEEPPAYVVLMPSVNETALKAHISHLENVNGQLKDLLENRDASVDVDVEQA